MATPDDPRFVAAVKLIERTGSKSFQIRFCDEEEPVVWIAIADYIRDGKTYYKFGAAVNPITAVFRLLEDAIDGAECVHCHRPAAFEADSEDGLDLPGDSFICWYTYDPRTKTFRKGCEKK